MKRISAIFLLIPVLMANAKIVKFSVNMTGQTINPSGVHVSGDFQEAAGYAANWNSEATSMTKEGNTEIYSVVVNIPAFKKYEFKFVNGDQFYEVEFVPEKSRVGFDFIDNRWIYIDSLNNDTTKLPVLLFAGNAPAGKLLLRFKVNLKKQSTIDSKGIHVAGSFNNWQYNNSYMWTFDGKTYEFMAYLDTAEFEYRFLNGDLQSKMETVNGNCVNLNGNRKITLKSDTVLDIVCFNACIDCISDNISKLLNTEKIKVFPNPANEYFMIDLGNANKSCNISIFDFTGKKVFELENINENTFKIDTQNLHQGVYLVKIKNSSDINSSIVLFLENK